jgi:hypothetical protein
VYGLISVEGNLVCCVSCKGVRRKHDALKFITRNPDHATALIIVPTPPWGACQKPVKFSCVVNIGIHLDYEACQIEWSTR